MKRKFIALTVLLCVLGCLCSCTQKDVTPTSAPTAQQTTEAPKKVLTADEVVELFNEKFDLFSEKCEYDADIVEESWSDDGSTNEFEFSEKCKYIGGKINFAQIQNDDTLCLWWNVCFQLNSSGKIFNKLERSIEKYLDGQDPTLIRHIDSYVNVEITETDNGTEYVFKLPDEVNIYALCNREMKIIVDNNGNLSYFESRQNFLQTYEYEEGKTYSFEQNNGTIEKVTFNATENVQIDLSQYEEELNKFDTSK